MHFRELEYKIRQKKTQWNLLPQISNLFVLRIITRIIGEKNFITKIVVGAVKITISKFLTFIIFVFLVTK